MQYKLSEIVAYFFLNNGIMMLFRTSNGKSSTVNALLKQEILPTGAGHTSNCFVQVAGTENTHCSVLVEVAGSPPKLITDIQVQVNAHLM